MCKHLQNQTCYSPTYSHTHMMQIFCQFMSNDISCASHTYLRHIRCISHSSQVYFWQISGRYQLDIWYIPGLYQENHRHISGIYQEYQRHISGLSLVYLQGYQTYFRNISGIAKVHLINILYIKIYQIFVLTHLCTTLVLVVAQNAKIQPIQPISFVGHICPPPCLIKDSETSAW